MAKTLNNPLEKEVQKSICQYLDLLGITYSKTDASRTFSKDGRPRRSKVTPDWPDITAVLPMKLDINGKKFPIGIAFFIEVKRAKGSPVRPGQKERLTQLRATGALAIVARSVDDVQFVVKKYFNRCPSLLLSDPLPKFAWEKSNDESVVQATQKASVAGVVSNRVQQLIRERAARRLS